MKQDISRRGFIAAVGAAAAAGAAAKAVGADASAAAPAGKAARIIGVCTSPRKGKNTATALAACLAGAKGADPAIETEMIELAGLKIPGNLAAGVPLEAGETDDFPALMPKLADPRVIAILIGSPVYFGNMSSLCKAFLDRCIAFRKNFALAGKAAGALAVGGSRNGGQEMTIRTIHTALMGQGMIIVGDGPPVSHPGAALWSGAGKNGVADDAFGLGTARTLGRHVATIALRLAGRRP